MSCIVHSHSLARGGFPEEGRSQTELLRSLACDSICPESLQLFHELDCLQELDLDGAISVVIGCKKFGATYLGLLRAFSNLQRR